MKSKYISPWPYFLLTALLGVVPVLNNIYPRSFFPAIPPLGVEIISVFLGSAVAFMGFARGWVGLQIRARAVGLIRELIDQRHLNLPEDINEVNLAGRMVTRLVRNADADLREIQPDFSMESLFRLQRYLPVLLNEIENPTDASIRLGVVGVYLGETACRHFGWQWYFKADPALKQFSFLCSILKKEERELDPFAWAADLIEKRKTIAQWRNEI